MKNSPVRRLPELVCAALLIVALAGCNSNKSSPAAGTPLVSAAPKVPAQMPDEDTPGRFEVRTEAMPIEAAG